MNIRDPGTILSRAAATLDFAEPVAVMLLGILLYLDDSEDPYGIVRQPMDVVPPGSYLAVSTAPAMLTPGSPREHGSSMGLELQGPGVVTLDAWHLGGGQPRRHPPRLLRSRLQELTARVGFAGVSGRSGS